MTKVTGAQAPLVSVILPANNEAALIGGCLSALLASDWTRSDSVQVVVVANGCQDTTADVARSMSDPFSAKGWRLDVLDLAQGNKLTALNAGEDISMGSIRIYLDADVTVSPDLIAQMANHLDKPDPAYASGTLIITAKGWVSRAYARFWRKVPFMTNDVPGCGVFGVNAAGRARWDRFPAIIADDLFVRNSFAPVERCAVPASYQWPIAEGFATLVRVRRRQNAGVDELDHKFPHLRENDGKAPFGITQKLTMALRDPLGFIVYTAVAMAVKLTRHRRSGWSRGR